MTCWNITGPCFHVMPRKHSRCPNTAAASSRRCVLTACTHEQGVPMLHAGQGQCCMQGRVAPPVALLVAHAYQQRDPTQQDVGRQAVVPVAGPGAAAQQTRVTYTAQCLAKPLLSLPRSSRQETLAVPQLQTRGQPFMLLVMPQSVLCYAARNSTSALCCLLGCVLCCA